MAKSKALRGPSHLVYVLAMAFLSSSASLLVATDVRGDGPIENGRRSAAVKDGIDIRDYGAACDGIKDDSGALAAANAAAGEGTALVVSCRARIAQPVSKVAALVRFRAGGSLDVVLGGAVAFTGGIDAPPVQILNLRGGTVRVQGRRTSTVRAEWWGVKCDGASDDSKELQDVLESSAANVQFPAGVCRIKAPCSVTHDVALNGNTTTLLFDFAGMGLTGKGQKFQATGITFDGNDKASGLVELVSGSFRFMRCQFKNVYGRTDAAKGLVLVGDVTGEIRECEFESIRALGNGVEGDILGVSRGIFMNGAPADVLISDNQFINIHTVDRSGAPIMEDADAIHVFGNANAHVRIERNRFTDIGKRAVKLQCNGAVVQNNTVIASWRDRTHAMFAAVGVFGSFNTVRGNTFGGTYYQHGIEITAPHAQGNVVEGNTIVDSGSFRDAGPYGERDGIIAIEQVGCRIKGNSISRFHNGIEIRGGAEVVIGSNVLAENTCGINVVGKVVGGVSISGNSIEGRTIGRGSTGMGVYVAARTEGARISGNVFRRLNTGIQLADEAGATSRVSENAFFEIPRGRTLIALGKKQ